MLVEFLLIPCLFISFAGWGAWAKMIIKNKSDSFSLTVCLGFTLFGISTCLLSFFISLNLYIELALLFFSLIPFLSKNLRTYTISFPKELLKSVWFWIFCIIIILAGSYQPFRPDHFSYYQATINWLNKYGLIIGVGNIDWLLGQTSLFHIVQAGLDQTIDPFQRLNVFITILFLIYIFERKAWLLLFAIPFYFLFIQTPSPDVIIVFLSLLVVNELCFNFKAGNFIILLLISVFAFTIKPVAFWLPLWTYIAGLFLNKKELKDFRIYLIPALFIIIFLIKNVVVSSTLFYPVVSTKLDTYWLTDANILEMSSQRASLHTFNFYLTGDEISKMTFFQNIYYWLSINKLQTIVNCFMTIIIVAFGIFAFLKKNIIYKSLWIIILIKFFIILSFSGQYRFLLESIYPLLFIMFYPIKIGKTKLFVFGLSYFLLLLTFISYPPILKKSIPEFKLTDWMKGYTSKALLIPERNDKIEYTTGSFGNLNFNISPHYYVYDIPPPAFTQKQLRLYYKLGIFPQMKDPKNIRKGYYMKKLKPEISD